MNSGEYYHSYKDLITSAITLTTILAEDPSNNRFTGMAKAEIGTCAELYIHEILNDLKLRKFLLSIQQSRKLDGQQIDFRCGRALSFIDLQVKTSARRAADVKEELFMHSPPIFTLSVFDYQNNIIPPDALSYFIVLWGAAPQLAHELFWQELKNPAEGPKWESYQQFWSMSDKLPNIWTYAYGTQLMEIMSEYPPLSSSQLGAGNFA